MLKRIFSVLLLVLLMLALVACQENEDGTGKTGEEGTTTAAPDGGTTTTKPGGSTDPKPSGGDGEWSPWI